jgi:hypothetical protein
MKNSKAQQAGAKMRSDLRRMNRSLSIALGYEVTSENQAAAINSLNENRLRILRESEYWRVMAFAKLAPILAAMATLDASINDFINSNEFSPLVEGAVGDLMIELQDYLRESPGLIAGDAAKFVVS